MHLLAILLFIAAVFGFLAAAMVLLRDYHNPQNISFFGIGLGVTVWVVGISCFILSTGSIAPLLWARIYYSAPIILVYSSLEFSQYFLYTKKLPKAINFLLFISGFILLTLFLSDNTFLIAKIIHRTYGYQISLQHLGYLLYSLYLVLCFLIVIILVFYKSIKSQQIQYKQQARIFLFGYIASFILGLFFNLILPWFGDYRLIAVGPLMTPIFFVSISYAIIKRRLFDIRLAFTRLLAYAASLVFIGIIFSFVSFDIVGFVFRHTNITQTETRLIYTMIAVLLVFIFPYPKKFFDNFTKRYFHQDSYDVQNFLYNFNKTLVTNYNLSSLLKNVSVVIQENLKPSFIFFYIRNNDVADNNKTSSHVQPLLNAQEWTALDKGLVNLRKKIISVDSLSAQYKDIQDMLKSKNISVLARLTMNVRDEGIGYMVFANKKSGNIYNLKDLEIIEIIANELVVAIQNALRTEEIERFNITLQNKVRESTNRLRKTNEKLRALDEAKDDFVSMASHQLRTPLTSVKGNISLILDGDAGKISDLQRQLLNQAFVGSQKMVYLISDLLNVSRLKTGKFIIDRSETDLASVIEEEVNQLLDSAKSRSITLSYNKPKDFPFMMLDEIKSRQVIMNFIDNAIYYTPAGGHIEVELSQTKSSVEFKVIDNGMGVPKDDQPHLFTKFYRAGNARKVRPDGTGLGLFLAKKIIISEGGSIIFKTELDKGSVFGFSFPKSNVVPNP